VVPKGNPQGCYASGIFLGQNHQMLLQLSTRSVTVLNANIQEGNIKSNKLNDA